MKSYPEWLEEQRKREQRMGQVMFGLAFLILIGFVLLVQLSCGGVVGELATEDGGHTQDAGSVTGHTKDAGSVTACQVCESCVATSAQASLECYRTCDEPCSNDCLVSDYPDGGPALEAAYLACIQTCHSQCSVQCPTDFSKCKVDSKGFCSECS